MDTCYFFTHNHGFLAFFQEWRLPLFPVDKLRFEMEGKSGVTSGIISYFLRNPSELHLDHAGR